MNKSQKPNPEISLSTSIVSPHSKLEKLLSEVSKNIVKDYKRPKKEYRLKIVVAGEGGVGKTSLLNRYVSNKFLENMKMTIGTDFFTQVLDYDGWIVKLQFWDFGGEKCFRFLLPGYCKGARGVLLAFDLTEFTTLLGLKEWLQLIRENTTNPVIILVGTKADDAGVLDEELTKEFCVINEIDEFIPTSSKTGENVEFVFQELIRRIIARK